MVLLILGQRSRTRFILMPTQGEGRPCPTELTQHKTCPMTPCYSWVLSNWSACKLEVGHIVTFKAMFLSLSKVLVCSHLQGDGTHCTAPGPGAVYFYATESMEKRTKWLNFIQSDLARKINAHRYQLFVISWIRGLSIFLAS